MDKSSQCGPWVNLKINDKISNRKARSQINQRIGQQDSSVGEVLAVKPSSLSLIPWPCGGRRELIPTR